MAGKARKSATVRVTATRNLDMMNAGQIAEIDRDEQVEKLLEQGYLVEVDEQGQAKDGSNPAAAVDPNAAATGTSGSTGSTGSSGAEASR